MHPPLRFKIGQCPFTMIPIQGDTFLMGSEKATDPDAFGDEGPPHRVKVPSFYLAQLPVTQDLWTTVMENDWEHLMFSGATRPMERVSWDDVQEFLDKLEIKTGRRFRLPTEAEWEFAARGGVYYNGCKYVGSNRLKEVGWYSENSHGETKSVGRKFPNELGLYDMSGNVWEWCEDQWHGNYNDAPDDGSAWVDQEQGSGRVDRGGSWVFDPQGCRSAYRSLWNPGPRNYALGFRLALSLSLQSVGSPSVAGL